MVLGEFQRQARGHPCMGFMGFALEAISCFLSYWDTKFHYHEVSQDIWCVCVCVFSLMTLLQYEGNIICILLTNSYFLIIRFSFLIFFPCVLC
jgi:hypothetical protein